jgi:hypothetical protein
MQCLWIKLLLFESAFAGVVAIINEPLTTKAAMPNIVLAFFFSFIAIFLTSARLQPTLVGHASRTAMSISGQVFPFRKGFRNGTF